jgi:hypothetical protein
MKMLWSMTDPFFLLTRESGARLQGLGAQFDPTGEAQRGAV